MDKPKVLIQDWYFGCDEIEMFLSPDQRQLRLYGKVYGHPRIEDGHRVSTSTVLSIDYEKMEVETRNTIYELGIMSERVYG